MKNILREIFDDEYDITPKRDKRQRELDLEPCEEWDKVERMFGGEFVDRILELEGDGRTSRRSTIIRRAFAWWSG